MPKMNLAYAAAGLYMRPYKVKEKQWIYKIHDGGMRGKVLFNSLDFGPPLRTHRLAFIYGGNKLRLLVNQP